MQNDGVVVCVLDNIKQHAMQANIYEDVASTPISMGLPSLRQNDVFRKNEFDFIRFYRCVSVAK